MLKKQFMNLQLLKENIEGIDIYILDQLLKDRFSLGAKILDAGCGRGRNLKWFNNHNFEISGIDISEEAVEYCKVNCPKHKANFKQATLTAIPFETAYFDHIICNAVLHFAENATHFNAMFIELLRVLKSKGSLFIRVASIFGIENQVELIGDGVYKLPDGSTRFLVTQSILENLEQKYKVSLIENVKTTIVHNNRSMTTLVLKKNN